MKMDFQLPAVLLGKFLDQELVVLNYEVIFPVACEKPFTYSFLCTVPCLCVFVQLNKETLHP